MTDAVQRLSTALADRYRIERELGAGGMATVYLAQDLKHDRQVAVKVLRPELAAVLGAERFVVEIKTTAALQHPHILPLFDSGTADGFLYYVMPYIDGETLRSKLDRETQLSIEEAVRITTQVADALDYAHRRGVIHRDIKPENILLHDGRPMVADFGIALAVSAAAGGRMTETGLSLGTPHYMSPEQATAEKEITGKSDIYSLASVLYEMLTGNPPHVGASAQQIIMKIIAEPVQPVTALRKSVPPNVAAAIGKALEKLPADRFESTKAFAEALGNPAFTNATASVLPARSQPPRFWQLVSAGLAVTTLVSLGFAIAGRESASETGLSRYRVLLSDAEDQDLPPIISPSGEWVGWAREDGSVMLRRRGAPTAVAVPGTQGAYFVAFSPEDSAIAFVSSGALNVVALAGGAPRRLTSARQNIVTWGADGWIYFTDDSLGISRVPAVGGMTEVLTRPDSLAWLHLVTQVLPGRAGMLLLTIVDRTNRTSVAVWDNTARQVRRLTPGLAASYLAPGYLVFAREDGTLWGARFDRRRRQMVTDPVQLESGVKMAEWPMMALSSRGTLLYRAGPSHQSGRLARVDRNGRVALLPIASSGWFRGVRVSPDGRRLAFGLWGESGNRSPIMVYDLSIGLVYFDRYGNRQPDVGRSRDLMPEWSVFDPVWSLDGRRIAFHADQSANLDSALATSGWDGFEVAADGGGRPRRLYRSASLVAPDAWTPDGRLIVRGSADSSDGGDDLFLVSFHGDSASVERLLDAPWSESMPRLSPDGRWLAYLANPGDTVQVFVRPFPDVGSRVVQVSVRNGTAPLWSRDGRTLYYLEPMKRDSSDTPPGAVGTNLVAARVRTTPTFEVESRTVVIANVRYQHPICCISNYDVLPEGSGFIMAVADTSAAQSQLILVENLLSHLKAITRR